MSTIIKVILGAVAGFAGLCAFLCWCLYWARHPGRRPHKAMHLAENGDDEADEEKRLKKELGTMDRILIILGIFLFLFVVTMIVLFCVKGSTPDTLIISVFGACAVEGGIMGAIQRRKITIRSRIEEIKGGDAARKEEDAP